MQCKSANFVYYGKTRFETFIHKSPFVVTHSDYKFSGSVDADPGLDCRWVNAIQSGQSFSLVCGIDIRVFPIVY